MYSLPIIGRRVGVNNAPYMLNPTNNFLRASTGLSPMKCVILQSIVKIKEILVFNPVYRGVRCAIRCCDVIIICHETEIIHMDIRIEQNLTINTSSKSHYLSRGISFHIRRYNHHKSFLPRETMYRISEIRNKRFQVLRNSNFHHNPIKPIFPKSATPVTGFTRLVQ